MNASVRWLNRYLEPGNLTPAEAEQALTSAGFPIESTTPLPDGDTRLDVEVTSNRGDCLSHLGLAREIATITGRTFKPPVSKGSEEGTTTELSGAATLTNMVPDGCPLFTARVIRGVKVGPSPKWLKEALEAIGQRSINNVVDVTNFVAAEFGQPSHVFDLGTLQGSGRGAPSVVVRGARTGEKLALLDAREVTLREGELIVADGPEGARPISLAGIMGGALTQVTDRTTDVLLEAATWDPVTVRSAARRLGIRTEASHRFERIVDARTIDSAARRAAELIVEVAGGRLVPGALEMGLPTRPLTTVQLRTARCAALLGVAHAAPKVADLLTRLGIEVRGGGEVLTCTIPAHRPDLAREVDLIEEVARTAGIDALPIHDTVAVRIGPPQQAELASRLMGTVLAGLGFFETVTFSFVTPKQSSAFTPPGLKNVSVLAESRKADPVLRPSVIPSLLACRRLNHDGGAMAAGGVRLFETAAAFAQDASGQSIESRRLALVADADMSLGASAHERRQAAVRLVRGALEQVVQALGGAGRGGEGLRVVPADGTSSPSGLDPTASGWVELAGVRIGALGLVAPAVLAAFDLETPVAAAEVELAPLLALYPPRSSAKHLPEFPGIERDLSLVVSESVRWEQLAALVESTKLERLEGATFVGTYRGQQAGPGKKSVTLRLRFRDPGRTLRHEEVDPAVARLVEAASKSVGAELRK